MPHQPPVPQPAKAVLASRRITNRRVSRTLGFSEHYVSRCLNGWQAPSHRFRQQLSAFVGLPEADLFTAESVGAA